MDMDDEKAMENIYKRAEKIRFLILDVDGVLTNGGIILDNEGNEFKAFHVRDGHGIKMLIRHGINVAIVTGRHSRVVERRSHELGIKEVYQKCYDKRVAYNELKKKYNLEDEEIAYIGDDIVDIPILVRTGLAVVVSDAAEDAKRFAHYITKNRGGHGAVREVSDLILKAKGVWKEIIDGYSKI